MAWGWSTKKEEEKEEVDAGSLDLTDMSTVSVKMQELLENARNKFEDKYKDVKLRYD